MSPRELIGKTFKHLRTGGLYRVITTGVHVDTKEVLVTYVALKDGVMWVRSYLEFVDGRFEEQA
jgi:hypothetical protein